MVEYEVLKMNQVLSPCNSRRGSNASKSPEFEFWMVRNPSFPQPNLQSADELFSEGILLPLHHHSTSFSPNPPTPKDLQRFPQVQGRLPLQSKGRKELDRKTHRGETGHQLESAAIYTTRPQSEFGSTGSDISASIFSLSTSGFTSSKRWKYIFKKSDKKCCNNINNNSNNNNFNNREKGKEKMKKKEKRNLAIGSGGNNGVAAAELNINIWPFRRSKSAGNGGNRPRTTATTRKVSSAPCSRSNSGGESKSRKWPSSPRRAGVHLGRSSPIWQVCHAASGADGRSFYEAGMNAEKSTRNDENESGKTGTLGGGAGGRISDSAFNNAEKVIRIDEHESSRKFPVAGTISSCGGDGGRSFDSVEKNAEKGTRKDGNEACRKFSAVVAGGSGGGGGGLKGKVLSLKVPMCIGYGSRLGCRSDEHNVVSLASTATGGVSGGSPNDGAATMEGVRGGNLFNIRSLFTKKIY